MEVGAAFQAWLRATNSLRCWRSRIAASRSSIRSRSTSQYLSDERRREGVRSRSVVSSLAIIGGRNLPDSLAKLRRLRLNFAFRERVRLGRRAPINSPQRVQPHNGRSSCAKSSEYFTSCCVIQSCSQKFPEKFKNRRNI